MKKILKLLTRLETAEGGFFTIKIFTDFSGGVFQDDGEVTRFKNKRHCVKILKRLLSNAK